MPRGVKWPEKMERFLVRCHEKGMTAREIATCMRMPLASIRSKQAQLGITPNPPGEWPEPDLDFFERYGKAGTPELKVV